VKVLLVVYLPSTCIALGSTLNRTTSPRDVTATRTAFAAAAATPQGALMVNDEELLQGFVRCRQLGALPQVRTAAAAAQISEQTAAAAAAAAVAAAAGSTAAGRLCCCRQKQG
jgi:hypothetical protein